MKDVQLHVLLFFATSTTMSVKTNILQETIIHIFRYRCIYMCDFTYIRKDIYIYTSPSSRIDV